MSDIRFNRWLHQSGTGGVYQDSSGRVGIGSSVPTTALDIVGIVSATSFTGNLTGNVVGNVTGNINSTGVTTVTSLRIGTGTSISSPATNVLTLGTNDSERVRITSSGLVGIGTDIPGSYDSGGRTLVISENSTLAGMTIRSSNQGAIYFSDGLTGNEAYRGRIEYSHSADSLNFGTAGTGSRVNIDSSGRLLVGATSSPATAPRLVVQSNPNSSTGQANVYLQRGDNTYTADTVLGAITFTDSSANIFSTIEGQIDALLFTSWRDVS